MDSQYFIDLEKKFGANNYKPLDVVLSKGAGVWVEDVAGNRYLDCLSSYSALNQGHCHPKILAAMVEQAQKITLTSRAFRNDKLGLFYKKLSDMTGYGMSLPMNSGAEAVETAIKVARKWAYSVKGIPRNKAEIIVADGNFHGRTVTIISFSSTPLYKDDFGPFTPGFRMVSYGNLDQIKEMMNPNTAAVLIEPIQGENGVIIPPNGYLKGISDLCKENNVLLIADEIQTGLGRVGRLFASQYENVRPDMITIGKALSGGFYPISAVLADPEILGIITPGEHGSTFGGNPLASAIGLASLEVIEEEHLIKNSEKMGNYFMDHLSEINSPHIKEVRGKGLLIGVELHPEAGGARRFCEALQLEGILAKETHDHVIRFAPPLIIQKETIDWAIPKIRKILQMT